MLFGLCGKQLLNSKHPLNPSFKHPHGIFQITKRAMINIILSQTGRKSGTEKIAWQTIQLTDIHLASIAKERQEFGAVLPIKQYACPLKKSRLIL